MSRGAASRDARKLFTLRRDRLGNEYALLYLTGPPRVTRPFSRSVRAALQCILRPGGGAIQCSGLQTGGRL